MKVFVIYLCRRITSHCNCERHVNMIRSPYMNTKTSSKDSNDRLNDLICLNMFQLDMGYTYCLHLQRHLLIQLEKFIYCTFQSSFQAEICDETHVREMRGFEDKISYLVKPLSHSKSSLPFEVLYCYASLLSQRQLN